MEATPLPELGRPQPGRPESGRSDRGPLDREGSRPGPSAALSPMLGRLAEERATGVLTRERGVLYLVEGQVVHAESPATPGLDVLLTSRGALGSEGWWEAVSEAGAECRVGRFLVDSGRLAAGALELCHLGALYDAAFFTLGTSSGPARFRYGVAHWIGPVRPVTVYAVERETLRRRALLHRIWPDADPDTAELVRTGRAVDAVLPPRQRTVLDQVDGVRTAADISLVLGRPGFHTLVDVRRLAAAGIVTTRARTVEVRAPQTAAPTAPPPGSTAPSSTASASTASASTATTQATQAAQAAQASAEPDVALLRRLRDALEAL